MIQIDGLTKRFSGRIALDRVSFEVKAGQIAGFLGENGAGKTTTLDILCGCIGADSGTARIGGLEISESPIEIKKQVGYLPDDPPMHLDMRVTDYLAYVAKLKHIPQNKVLHHVSDCLEKLSLGDVRNRIIKHLSKGFRQRVGLAQAIIHNPKVLVLDEPTEGLDPQQIRQIRQLIHDLKGEHTILFSSHILTEVESLCDDIIVIKNGSIVGQEQNLRLEQGQFADRYSLRVGHLSDELIPMLSTIKGVKKVEIECLEDCLVILQIDETTNVLDRVALTVIENGNGLIELAKSMTNLEDRYFQLTERGVVN